MPTQMPPFQVQRLLAWVGIFLLGSASSACDKGFVQLELLDGAVPQGAQAGAGAAGRGASGALSESPAAGSGAMPPKLPPYPCEEVSELEQAQEDELRETLNDAFSSGRFCPSLGASQRRELAFDSDLQWRARGIICFALDSVSWFPVPRSPGAVGWVLVETPNLEDAKKALLGGDHSKLCEEAEKTQMRRLAVGHFWDAWSVIVAPAQREEMQKP